MHWLSFLRVAVIRGFTIAVAVSAPITKMRVGNQL